MRNLQTVYLFIFANLRLFYVQKSEKCESLKIKYTISIKNQLQSGCGKTFKLNIFIFKLLLIVCTTYKNI